MEPITSQESEIKSISLPKTLINETQRLIPKVNYNKLLTFLLEKYLHELKQKVMRNRYQEYYGSLTIRDKEEELELMKDFAFSEHELDLFLKAGESNV